MSRFKSIQKTKRGGFVQHTLDIATLLSSEKRKEAKENHMSRFKSIQKTKRGGFVQHTLDIATLLFF